jgi:hypothetical protein
MIAKRVGLKLLDEFEVLNGGNFRRDLLLVDTLAIDDGHLRLIRHSAKATCFLFQIDAKPFLTRFDENLDTLAKYGVIRSLELGQVSLPEPLSTEVMRTERNARSTLERGLREDRMPDGSTKVNNPIGSYALTKTYADLMRARQYAATSSTVDEHLIPLATGKVVSTLGRGSRQEEVVRVVLHNLPTPNQQTRLEEVLEFKADEKAKLALAQLRAWMVTIANSPQTEVQIQSTLEAILEEYRSAMKVHHLKTEASAVEVLVVTATEIVENLVRLKFSDVARKLFQIFKDDVALMEAEINCRGKELAYIDIAERRFPQ